VLTISGSITIQSSGNTTLALLEHQYAFVPAGVLHGFKATDGPVCLYRNQLIVYYRDLLLLANTLLALEGNSCIKTSDCQFV
jgi:hypothetical protein